jgi:hypothetical protein
MRPNVDVERRFDHILETLWDETETVRESAMDVLAEFLEEIESPALRIGMKALRAAARPFPFQKPDPGRVSANLVAVACAAPRPEYVPVVLELFGQFSDDAKQDAQIILTELESHEAAEALMTIVRTHAPIGGLPCLIESRLVNRPRHADVFFPEILKYACNPDLAFAIHQLCLAYCEARLLSSDQLDQCIEPIFEAYSALVGPMRSAQRDEGIDWMWDDDYHDLRSHAALLLDLLSYFSIGRVEAPLREALEFRDPRLKYFAIVSLLRHGKAVDVKHVDDVARDAEMRNWLFIALDQHGQASLFPERFRTQEAFAESDMVNWLTFPTELSRAPSEIELMKIVTVDTGLLDGVYDYFLFRFRTNNPHWAAKDGWMAGVSGPFLRKDQPTTNALGDTFSTFTKWEEKSPDEHVGNLRELMQQWREYHSKNTAS